MKKLEHLFTPGMIVSLDKKKGIIPDPKTILKFWDKPNTQIMAYQKMTNDEFIQDKLNCYSSASCVECRFQSGSFDVDHPEYVVYFVDHLTGELTGDQATHVCERDLKLWKD